MKFILFLFELNYNIMKKLALFVLLMSVFCFGQDNNLLDRLSVLENNGKLWYNIDGYSITSEEFSYPFNEEGLKKVFNKHKISNKDIKTKNNNIHTDNFFVTKNSKIIGDIQQVNNYYFVKNKNNNISVIWFIKARNTDKNMEEELVNMILENKIPKENYSLITPYVINFAGREIKLGRNCYWTALNTVQCPYNGEMNWSIHKDIQDAQNAIDNQLMITKHRKGSEVVAEKMVDVIFEGTPTKAKQVTLKLKGITAALEGMSGGKSLTIYYVAEKVRDRNVSCVMSFWNDDNINPKTKLPPLLEEIMELK